jgi:uncharacterized Fe-S center protein
MEPGVLDGIPVRSCGKDKFRDLWPRIDSTHLFGYAEKMGLGSAEYRLVEI